jgi:uncharacterized protein (TIGR03435 family)
MVKALLADRFKLKVHAGMQLLPVFDLVLAAKDGKPGPQLKVSTCDRLARSSGVAAADRPRPCVWSCLVKMDPATGITMGFEGMTMPALAAMLCKQPGNRSADSGSNGTHRRVRSAAHAAYAVPARAGRPRRLPQSRL